MLARPQILGYLDYLDWSISSLFFFLRALLCGPAAAAVAVAMASLLSHSIKIAAHSKRVTYFNFAYSVNECN